MSETKPADNPIEAPKLDLKVRVYPIVPQKNLLGFANVTINDCFVVNGIKVCSGENGLYINMPSTKDNKGEWHDTCYPVTSDFRNQLTEAVVDGYGAAVEKLQAKVEAAEKSAEKPSVTGALRENADKARPQHKPPAGPGKNEPQL